MVQIYATFGGQRLRIRRRAAWWIDRVESRDYVERQTPSHGSQVGPIAGNGASGNNLAD